MYLLFAGDFRYPEGGWKDFVAAAPSVNELQRKFTEDTDMGEWAQIVDGSSRDILLEGLREYNIERAMWKPVVWTIA